MGDHFLYDITPSYVPGTRIFELEDELLGALVGVGTTVTRAMDEVPGFVPCGKPAGIVMDGLLAASPASGAEEGALVDRIALTRDFIAHVSDHRGVAAGEEYDFSALRAADPAERNLKLMLLFGLQAIAAYARPALGASGEFREIAAFLFRSLALIGSPLDSAALHAATAQCAVFALKARELL